MIVLFTDFGLSGPYTGQMKAVLAEQAPAEAVIDLLADAPMFNPRASAHLLAAYCREFPTEAVFLCVVDPGVGSERQPVIVKAGGRYFVGPDNGLFHMLIKSDAAAEAWRITYRPPKLSASFHGRDLFAPVAAQIARGDAIPGEAVATDSLIGQSWPARLEEVIYIDHYGNALTGILEKDIDSGVRIEIGGHELSRARTFSDVGDKELFWYINSNGLVEVAQNGGSAARALGLEIGTKFRLNH